MKITVTQLRNIIKTEIKRLGGKGLNEAPRKGRALKPVAPTRVTKFDGTVGGLSKALQRFDGNMPVMFGKNGAFVPAGSLDETGRGGSVGFSPAAGRPITVSELIYELSDFEDTVPVVFGEKGAFVPARRAARGEVEIIDFDEYLTGEFAEVPDGEGEPHVCIMPAVG